MNKRIVVTGARGFLGKHLVNAAQERGDEVLLIHRVSDEQAIGCDDEKLEAKLSQFAPDAVVHLAATYADAAKGDGLQANLLLPLRLLEWAASNGGVKFISAGSFWQYGDLQSPGAVDFYSASKNALMAYLEYYRHREKVEAYQLVLSSTYGPDDHRGKLVDYLVRCAIANQSVQLGNKAKQFSLTDVRDVVAAILGVVDDSSQLSQLSYRVRADELYTFEQLSELFTELGVPLQLKFDNARFPFEILSPLDSDVPKLPNWQPRFCLADYLGYALSNIEPAGGA